MTDTVSDPSLDVADRCAPQAVTVETTDDGLYLDIDTTDCGWYTAQQSTLAGLEAGAQGHNLVPRRSVKG